VPPAGVAVNQASVLASNCRNHGSTATTFRINHSYYRKRVSRGQRPEARALIPAISQQSQIHPRLELPPSNPSPSLKFGSPSSLFGTPLHHPIPYLPIGNPSLYFLTALEPCINFCTPVFLSLAICPTIPTIPSVVEITTVP
jgi:hypothetical protein